MKDQVKRERRTNSLTIWLIVAGIFSPIAYILSYGPAILLVQWGYIE